MSRFLPVRLAPERRTAGRASMTMLKHYQSCPRSGYLYQLHKGGMQNAAMVRGSAMHLAFERAVEQMIAQQEPTIPDDVVKLIVDDVLAELPVPLAEHDYIRECAYRWSAEFTCDPSAVIASETLIVLEEFDGWHVRCKVDYAEAKAGGLVVNVQDWKSARGAPSYDELGRKRKDGSIAAKDFQLVLYALALAFGKPVREEREECPSCEGNGIAQNTDLPKAACETCAGSGRVRCEVIEPFPLAAQAERFDLEYVYPGIEDREGLMVRRQVSLDRLELAEYRESLRGILRRLDRDEASGEWPAIISDEACKECPAKAECPIPRELHDHAGVINTEAEAAEASEVLERRDDEQKALRKEIKAFVVGHELPELRYGKDKAWREVYGESERIADKDKMFAAVERAVTHGEPFDEAQFVKTVGSTRFTSVTLSPEELEGGAV